MTATATEVAQWMESQLANDECLYQDVAASGIAEKFGDTFVTVNERNGNLNINKDVLSEFKKLTGEAVVWERGQRYWRKRSDYDTSGRLQS